MSSIEVKGLSFLASTTESPTASPNPSIEVKGGIKVKSYVYNPLHPELTSHYIRKQPELFKEKEEKEKEKEKEKEVEK